VGGIAVISNPRSGVNRRNPGLVQRLAYVLGDTGDLVQPPDLDHLEATVRALREREIEVVCVSGGDGTLHKVVSALVRVYADGAEGDALRAVRLPEVAILKSGTVNTLARNVGQRTGAAEMLGRVVEMAHGGPPLRTVERTLMVVNGTYAGFIFGIGVLGRFMQAYYAGGTTGPLKALRVLARLVASQLLGTQYVKDMFRKEPWQVTVDDRPVDAPGFAAVAAGSVKDIGLGFELYPRALDDAERMHVLAFPCDPATVLRVLPSVYLGRVLDRPDILQSLPKRMVIEHQQPLAIMMDGDFIPGASRLVVEAGPRVRFLVA
jgi:diacylglycerol kinase family enzyme